MEEGLSIYFSWWDYLGLGLFLKEWGVEKKGGENQEKGGRT